MKERFKVYFVKCYPTSIGGSHNKGFPTLNKARKYQSPMPGCKIIADFLDANTGAVGDEGKIVSVDDTEIK